MTSGEIGMSVQRDGIVGYNRATTKIHENPERMRRERKA